MRAHLSIILSTSSQHNCVYIKRLSFVSHWLKNENSPKSRIYWTKKGHLRLMRPIGAILGQVDYLRPFEAISVRLRSFETIWGYLRLFETIFKSIWGYLRPFEAIWGHFKPFEALWGQLLLLLRAFRKTPFPLPTFLKVNETFLERFWLRSCPINSSWIKFLNWSLKAKYSRFYRHLGFSVSVLFCSKIWTTWTTWLLLFSAR